MYQRDNPRMTSNASVRVSRRYNVAVDKVFDAWLTPAQAARFLFATRTGNIMHCEIEPAIGGQFVVTDRRPVGDGEESFFEAQHRGTFIEIDRPKRLMFDFVVEPSATEPTRVTLDFVPLGVSMCELVLTHDMGEVDEPKTHAKRAEQGWTKMLDQLEKVLTTRSWGVTR